MWIAPAIGAVAGIGKSIFGASQSSEGSDLVRNTKRPTYTRPKEIDQNLSDAQRMALEGLPEEQKNQYIQNITRSQQFGMASASDRKGGLAGLAGMVQSGNDAYSDLLSKDAEARQKNQGILMNARNTMAQYKDKEFNVNQQNPYYENMARGRALQGAGEQNMWGGIGDVANSVGGMFGLGGIGDMFKPKPKMAKGMMETEERPMGGGGYDDGGGYGNYGSQG